MKKEKGSWEQAPDEAIMCAICGKYTWSMCYPMPICKYCFEKLIPHMKEIIAPTYKLVNITPENLTKFAWTIEKEEQNR